MFSKRLNDLIKKHNANQTILADYIGYTRQAIGKWCRGESEPDTKTIIKLANYFNVSTDYLLGNTNKGNEISPLIQYEALKKSLVNIGYMTNDEKFSKKEYDYIINYINNNKEYIKK